MLVLHWYWSTSHLIEMLYTVCRFILHSNELGNRAIVMHTRISVWIHPLLHKYHSCIAAHYGKLASTLTGLTCIWKCLVQIPATKDYPDWGLFVILPSLPRQILGADLKFGHDHLHITLQIHCPSYHYDLQPTLFSVIK